MNNRAYWLGYLQAELNYFGGVSLETAQMFMDNNPNPCLGVDE